MLDASKEQLIMLGSTKVGIGIYAVTLLTWLMKRSRTVRGLVFDLIDATLFFAVVIVVEALRPDIFDVRDLALIAAGLIIGKYGSRLSGMFWWRVEHVSIEVDAAGVKIKSEGDDTK